MSGYSRTLFLLAVIVINFLLLPGTNSAVNAAETDTDGDGLPDAWEEYGIDINEDGLIDFFPIGANPMRKDVFLEIDHMEGHFPGLDVINQVRHAFENAPVNNPDGSTGITLHIQLDEQIDHQNLTTGPEFSDIRDSYFGTEQQRPDPAFPFIESHTIEAKALVYHYAIFAHQMASDPSSSGGFYENNTFVVTLGASGWGEHPVTGHNVGSIDQRAGTLMHELGHSLGLNHGGSDGVNCKPNYLSIMSYSRQFTSPIAERPLDYSHSQLGSLNESFLSEPQGIESSTPAGLVTVLGPFYQYQTVTGLSVDYNQDGDTIDIFLPADINYLAGVGSCEESPDQLLQGHDDWTNLNYQTQAAVEAGGGKNPGFSGLNYYHANLKSRIPGRGFILPRYQEATIEDVIALRLLTLGDLHRSLQQLPESFYKKFPENINTSRFFIDTDPAAGRLRELIVYSKNDAAAGFLINLQSDFNQRGKSVFEKQELAAKQIVSKLANMILMFKKG